MSGPSSSRFRVVPFLLLILCLGLAIVGYGWYSYRQPDAILNRGRAAIARSDFDSAFVLADQLESRREVSLSHLLRGELFLAQNRFPEALHQFNQIKESGDIHLRTALLSGRCLLEMRNLPEAEKVYSYVLEMDPDQIDAYRGLAAIAYDFGLLTRSLDHLDQVVKRDPGDGRAHRFQGLIHKDMAAYGEAEQSYRKALECSLPPAAKEEVRKELAECLLNQTKYDVALEALGEPASSRDEGPDTLAVRAETLWRLGRLDDSARLLDQSISRYPDHGKLLLVRGQVRLGRGDSAGAVRDLVQAVELAPADYRARYQLSLAYAAANRPDDARKQQQRGEEVRKMLMEMSRLSEEAMKKPRDPEVRVQIAEICNRLGKTALAAMWYRAAESARQTQPKKEPAPGPPTIPGLDG